MYFTKEKAARYIADLKNYIYQDIKDISHVKIYQGDLVSAYQVDFADEEWENFKIGSRWGGRDITCWFRTRLQIPVEWKQQRLALYLDLGNGHQWGLKGAESLIYINGLPVQGLDHNHQEVYLKEEWLSQGEIVIAIKAFSGLEDQDHLFNEAKLVVINQEAEDFHYRLLAILQTVESLEEGDYDREHLLGFLNTAINSIDFRQPGSELFYSSLSKANSRLQEKLREYKGWGNKPTVRAVGHSHIDVAWLWRLCHTREKCSRTFSTVLHLMDQYPEYQYLQTMPQLYQFIKEDYPQIYKKIKEKIVEGRWEVTGGMWVEADCNIPAGESLVRQFLYGTRFIKEEFGVDCSILWLPEVFGYSWALPQIIKKSGLKYFMTTKISWNQFNRPEYDTFQWRGIDGTEVLTHFITTPSERQEYYTYNGILNPGTVKGIWDNYRQKSINDQLLIAYGYGDGGGGPNKEMLELAKKMQELPGILDIKFAKAEPFFAELEDRVSGNPGLPEWDGELYLEYHLIFL